MVQFSFPEVEPYLFCYSGWIRTGVPTEWPHTEKWMKDWATQWVRYIPAPLVYYRIKADNWMCINSVYHVTLIECIFILISINA